MILLANYLVMGVFLCLIVVYLYWTVTGLMGSNAEKTEQIIEAMSKHDTQVRYLPPAKPQPQEFSSSLAAVGYLEPRFDADGELRWYVAKIYEKVE